VNELIVKTAASQIGVKEIEGEEDNQTIVDYAKDIGLAWINDDETPWCAVFVNWVLRKAGFTQTKSALARSFDRYGEATMSPEPGDIVVFWRVSPSSGKGHVGIFLGESSDNKIFVLGGNQGNSVSIRKYSRSNIVSFRKVGTQESIEIPEAPIKFGEKGEEVEKLQRVLQHLGFKIVPDGIFGLNTKKAISDFQLTIHLTTTGAYDAFTQEALFSKLNE
jgi:uncharacterized protein (TIGR02594 family)